MKIAGKSTRTIAVADDGWRIEIIDQTRLPDELSIATLASVDAAARAIRDMQVRGAPLIGVTAAYGLALAMRVDDSDSGLEAARETLLATRPTAVNLQTMLQRCEEVLRATPRSQRAAAAYAFANDLCEADVACNRAIGNHGLALFRELLGEKLEAGERLNVMTHCNAGWLATVDWGTALAPVYAAQEQQVDCHVWVSETRPRNQGAALTAWELYQAGVDCTLVVDSACGHLMQRGEVDLCIVGTDRTTIEGDVCNKVGTYLKALAAHHSQVPFVVALPGSTIDSASKSIDDIPIEVRDPAEITGTLSTNSMNSGFSVAAHNPAFDVTPAHLVSALVTERGICEASRAGLLALFPELG